MRYGGDREGDQLGLPQGEGASGSKSTREEEQSRELKRRLKPFDEKPVNLSDCQTEEQYMAERKFVFLHHFSGKEDVLGTEMMKAAVQNKIKLEVISVDKDSNSGDLLAAEPYESHYKMATEGMIDGYHAGWPCTTFSRLRWRAQEGMPGPVRSREFPYGFPTNSVRRQEECDAGTVMLARSLNMAEAVERGKGGSTIGGFSTLENPPPSEHPEHQSAWEMRETECHIKKWKPFQVKFNTCVYQQKTPLGKRHYKPQMFVGSLRGLPGLRGECQCGDAGHESIVGVQRSRASATYPEELCVNYAALAMEHFKMMGHVEYLRKKLRHVETHINKMKRKAETLGAEPTPSKRPCSPFRGPKLEGPPSAVVESEWHGHHEVHEWRGGHGKREALKASTAKKEDPVQAVYVGGMRHPARTLRSMGVAQSLGVKIQGAWNHFSEANPQTMETAERYGTKECELDPEVILKWKETLKTLLEAKDPPGVQLVDNREYKSKLDAELFESWIEKSADPDTCIPDWIRDGVPLGIECKIPVRGIFPPSDEKGPPLETEDETATICRGDLINYMSVEENKEHAVDELERYERNKYLFRLTVDEAERDFRRRTLSRLGLILKEREDKTLKKRIVIDMRRSNGNLKAHLPERLVLPRPMDAIQMVRDMCGVDRGDNWPAEARWGSEFILIDVTDAFMSFGVRKEEWGHCLSPSPLGEGIGLVCFTALLFGFKTAPLLYSRLAAQVSRFLQACVPPQIGVHQTYLDDSLWFMQGPLVYRNKAISMILYTMAALGMKVALAKGHRAGTAQWIGVTFSLVNNEKIVMGLPEQFMKDTINVFESWATMGFAPMKSLRSVAGRMSWVAGVLPRTRWTVSVLYAILKDEEKRDYMDDSKKKNNKKGLFPVVRLEQTRLWLVKYLTKAMEMPLRQFAIKPKQYAEISITTDASPEGLGGYLVVNRKMIAAFSSKVTEEDADTLGFELGTSASQGKVEALALLVALKTWAKKIPQGLVEIRVQSDSIVALAVADKLAASSPGLNFLGACLGIQLEALQVERLKTTHVPGPANDVADFLSRPSKWRVQSKPAVLSDCPISYPEGRGDEFYELPSPQSQPGLWGRSEALPLHNAWVALRM